jgi:hypothetical protein
MEISRGSMSLRMQPRVREPNFATPWKGGGIGRAREDCFLLRRLWGAETYDLHITLGLHSESRLPKAYYPIPDSSGAEAPLLIQHLNPLHCKQ